MDERPLDIPRQLEYLAKRMLIQELAFENLSQLLYPGQDRLVKTNIGILSTEYADSMKALIEEYEDVLPNSFIQFPYRGDK